VDDTPKYTIGVAAELLAIHPQTLRLYESRGLVRPRRTAGGTRRYSDRDLARLRTINALTGDYGLSLVGVAHVLDMRDAMDGLRDRIARLESQLDAQQARHALEVADVHRSYRRDVVVWRPQGQSLEHRRSARGKPTRP